MAKNLILSTQQNGRDNKEPRNKNQDSRKRMLNANGRIRPKNKCMTV
jgi:hypothetical protein